MNQQMLPRFGAACGTLFTVGLFAGNRAGVMALEIATLVLFLPFLAYLCCSVLRQAEGTGGWLWVTALCGGLAGITLKLASIHPGSRRTESPTAHRSTPPSKRSGTQQPSPASCRSR